MEANLRAQEEAAGGGFPADAEALSAHVPERTGRFDRTVPGRGGQTLGGTSEEMLPVNT